MNLTPLDIQKQTFTRSLKGYHPDEVRAYLHLIAEEIERLIRDVDRLSRENAMVSASYPGPLRACTAISSSPVMKTMWSMISFRACTFA